METYVIEALKLIVVPLLIGGLSALLASKLALRKFITEKWWERKAEAYTAILESMYQMKRFYAVYIDREFRQKEIDGAQMEQIYRKKEESKQELLRRMDVVQFMLTVDAVSILVRLQKELETADDERKPNEWFEHVEDSWSALDKALNEMREAVRKDLRGQ